MPFQAGLTFTGVIVALVVVAAFETGNFEFRVAPLFEADGVTTARVPLLLCQFVESAGASSFPCALKFFYYSATSPTLFFQCSLVVQDVHNTVVP